MKTLILALTTLLLVNIVQAQTYVSLPLSSELLKQPIELDCGAVIREWRGAAINKTKVNNMCSLAEREFGPFIQDLGFSTNNKPFTYSLSFIPDSKNHRDLNDIIYRFANRSPQDDALTGYTVHEGRYIFNISNTRDQQFDVSLLHEFFHAMSYHYGVFDQHPGTLYDKKLKDEDLAKRFTKKIMGKE